VPNHLTFISPRAVDVRKHLDQAIASAAAAVDLIASLAPGADPLAAVNGMHDSYACAPSSSSSPPDAPRAALTSLATAAEQRAQDMHAMISFTSHQRLWEGLCRLRAEGIKLLAEYTALCMQHLAFLAMCAEGDDMVAAGLHSSKGGPCLLSYVSKPPRIKLMSLKELHSIC
jgi:hypothetical protein